jgi:hypothetical protein
MPRKGDRPKPKLHIAVLMAEALAARNGGVLPSMTYLFVNEYKQVASAIYRHPDAFVHIKQESLYAHRKYSASGWVKEAEELAAENGGLLPSSKWLIGNGYVTLVSKLTRFPDRFKHIPRHMLQITRTPEEWVLVAQRLAEENNGILDYHNVMANHHGLYNVMLRNRSLFSHIPLFVNRKLPITAAEWVPIAEMMANENNGMLQHAGWLLKNEYTGLCAALYRFPELFTHIVQPVLECIRGDYSLLGLRGGTKAQRDRVMDRYLNFTQDKLQEIFNG